jgi:hypothetical protein
MLSQHYDALPLERSDRRVIVITNPEVRRSSDYYAKLYAILDDATFINAIGHWLSVRDVRTFNPSTPAPLTESKVRAIAACVSDVERALIDLREGTSDCLMTAFDVSEYLSGCGLARLSPRAMSAAYAGAGLVSCSKLVTLHGKKHRVVAMRDADRLKDAPASELQRLLMGDRP